ncbi:Rid family detoxifying hydrolase [Pseudomonas trivialis]|uniref:Endoribonuclease n=1 Tax=Pseudomonas trivialis TaxID=200450 RepID=A0A0R2ZNF3_9PSED|nr:Rid family detoxifying hydrolase [Pseudomonas trivialis]KRP60011.1 endoribonuclease [Pseudomonas trivialis]SDS65104.1 reactive intermediate/imine deaminase [Pseudomonas trivialis]
MSKSAVHSDNAPAAMGTYSQAVKVNDTVYFTGQIALHPQTMILAEGFEAQVVQVFENLAAVAMAAGGSMKDIVRLGIFLTDLSNFGTVNEVMTRYFNAPFPARSTIAVSGLARDALVSIDAIMVLK